MNGLKCCGVDGVGKNESINNDTKELFNLTLSENANNARTHARIPNLKCVHKQLGKEHGHGYGYGY